MTLALWWQQLLVGLAGGIAAEVLHWYGLARKPRGTEPYTSGVLYWTTTVFMIALGGAMPLLYLAGSASALLCFHLGAATPLLLQKLVAAVPSVATPQGAADPSAPQSPTLKEFFTW